MNLLAFFLKRTSIPLLLLTVIIPSAIPFILYYLLVFVSDAFYTAGITPLVVQKLPHPSEFSVGKDFHYIAITANNASLSLSEHIFQENDLTGLKALKFQSNSQAQHYFSLKLIADEPSMKSAALFEFLQPTFQFGYDFLQTYHADVKTRFEISEEIPNVPEELADLPDIFLYFEVEESASRLGNGPENVTVRVKVNDSLSQIMMLNTPDENYKKLDVMSYYKPFWTGYSYQLKKNIDEWAMRYYGGGTSLNIDFARAEPSDRDTPIKSIKAEEFMILFGIISYVLQFILLTILASKNCDDTLLTLQQLGVSHWQVYLLLCAITAVISVVSQLIQMIVFHNLGFFPYNHFTMAANAFFAFLIGIGMAIDAIFVTLLFGEKRSKVIMSTTVLSLSLLVLPAILVVFIFELGIYDPSLLSQHSTEFLTTILPVFSSFGVINKLIALTRDIISKTTMKDYEWRIADNLLGLNKFFVVQDEFSECSLYLSKFGTQIISEYYNVCIFKDVSGRRLSWEVAAHFVIFLLITLYCSYVIKRRGFRPLRLYYIFQKEFWRRSRRVPATGAFSVRNVKLSYKVKRRCKKRNVILENFDFTLPEKEIAALVGESGRGKSTFMAFLAGELAPDQVENSNLKVFDAFDLKDPLHAYLIKPYIGYCTEDLANVFSDMSVYENVFYSQSLRPRVGPKKTKAETKAYLMELLTQMGLGDTFVLRRKASQLSGGMLRRLACCNSVVGSPRLLLFDEISAGVDPLLKRRIWGAVCRTEATVLLTTHDMAEVENVATRINVLQKRELVVSNDTIPQFLKRNQSTIVEIVVSTEEREESIADVIKSIFDVLEMSIIGHKMQLVIPNATECQKNQAVEFLDRCKDTGEVEYFQVRQFKIQHIYNEMINDEMLEDESVQELSGILDSTAMGQNTMREPSDKKRHNSVSISNHSSRAQIELLDSRISKTTIYKTYFKEQFARVKFSQLYIILLIGFGLSLLMEILTGLFMNIAETSGATFSLQSELQAQLLSLYRMQLGDHARECSWNYMENDYYVLEKEQQGFSMDDGQYPRCMSYLYAIGLNNIVSQQTFMGEDIFDYWHYLSSPYVQSDKKEQILPFSKSWDAGHYGDSKLVGRRNSLLAYLEPAEISANNHNCDFAQECQIECEKLQKGSQCAYFNVDDCVYKCTEDAQPSNCVNDKMYFRVVGASQMTKRQFMQQYRIFRQSQVYLKTYPKYSSTYAGSVDAMQHLLPPSFVALKKNSAKFAIHAPSIGNFELYDNYIRMKYGQLERIENCGYIPYTNNNYVSNDHGDQPLYFNIRIFHNTKTVLPDPVIWFSPDFGVVHRFSEAHIREWLANSDQVADEEDAFKFEYRMESTSFPSLGSTAPINIEAAETYKAVISIVKNILFVIIGLLPFLVVSNWIAGEYESGLPELLKIHRIKLYHIVLGRMSFCLTLIGLYVTMILLLEVVFCSEILIEITNLGAFWAFFALTCLFTLPSGLLLGMIAKQPKYTSLIAILAIVLCIIFILLEIANNELAAIISVVFPFYGMLFALEGLSNNEPIQALSISVASCIFVLQIAIYVAMCYVQLQATKGDSQAATQKSSYIQVDNVDFWYNKRAHALDNVTFGIQRNRIFGLLGTNGSGKSTLMNIMIGNLILKRGQIFVDGKDLFASQKQLIILVPQKELLVQNLTVMDHLILFSSLNNNFTYAHILKELKLEDVLYETAATLSGGQKRRLSIAVALTSTAPIVAFDEPSTGLGAQTKLVVQESIEEVSKMGRTVILTTHDIDEVEALVDDAVVLKNGHIVFCGSVQGMRREGVCVDCTDPLIVNEVWQLLESPCDIESSSRYSTVFAAGNTEFEVYEKLSQAGLNECQFCIRKSTLEEDFVQILK